MDQVGPLGVSRRLWLPVIAAVLVACAGTPPFFQRHFSSSFQGSHDLWERLLVERYGCDTVMIQAMARTRRYVQLGMPACDLAAVIAPETVRAWRTADDGIREEWIVRTGAGTTGSVYLEGPRENVLRVANPVSRLGDLVGESR